MRSCAAKADSERVREASAAAQRILAGHPADGELTCLGKLSGSRQRKETQPPWTSQQHKASSSPSSRQPGVERCAAHLCGDGGLFNIARYYPTIQAIHRLGSGFPRRLCWRMGRPARRYCEPWLLALRGKRSRHSQYVVLADCINGALAFEVAKDKWHTPLAGTQDPAALQQRLDPLPISRRAGAHYVHSVRSNLTFSRSTSECAS